MTTVPGPGRKSSAMPTTMMTAPMAATHNRRNSCIVFNKAHPPSDSTGGTLLSPGGFWEGGIQSGDMEGAVSFEAVMGLITARRTNLRIDPERPVGPALIGRLCRAATLAPNHRVTEPWRFAVLTGSARAALGEIAAHQLATRGVTDPARVDKARGKYPRAPVVVAAGCETDADPIRHAEDRDAVAAGVQNLLLAASAAGLATYWATGATARSPETARVCGFEGGTVIVALIYLGWPTAPAPSGHRSALAITWAGGT